MINKVLVGIKRVIRPLIPDSIMARMRLAQHSRMVRNNVDIYEPDRASARRWLRLTPDTYRVISGSPPPSTKADAVAIGTVDAELARFLGWHGSEVVVRGRVNRPAMRGMRVVEPTVASLSLVTTAEVLGELPLDEQAGADQVLRFATDAGRRIGLIPEITNDSVTPQEGQIVIPAVVILSAVPLHDIGGGSRASQIAFEFLRRGYHVTYVHRYPSSEGSDLGLRYVHQNLAQVSFDRFDPTHLAARASDGTVIVEAPTREFLAQAQILKRNGWSVVYDLIDDWTDQALGGDWYDSDIERQIISLADGITCSADDLVLRIEELGRNALLVPNGVNDALFGAPVSGERPSDLPAGSVIVYHGSLYGSWFDWDALKRVAEGFPDHAIAIIGDPRGVPESMPPNVHFLGLKAQGDLPAYLTRCDIGIVPFVVNDLTHAVSPLKVYEYLACGLPVASTPLRPLVDLDGVYVDDDLVVAVRTALAAPKPDRAAESAKHSWGSRLEVLMASVGNRLRDIDNRGVTVFTRPPHHYGKKYRWIKAPRQ